MGRLDQLGDAVRSLVKQGDAPQVIRAYHGSPYDFDRFDASKIGTGEGAQAYGHGLYFAGNEPVAKSYRDQLSRNSFMVEGASAPMTESMMDSIGIDTPTQGIIRRALRDGVDPIGRLEQMRSGYGPLSLHHNRLSDAIEVLRSAKGKLIPNPGRMYEVEIGHPESALLDWDQPVHAQPDQIYDALGWSARNPLFDTLGRDGWTGRRAYYKMAGELGGSDKAAKSLLDSGVPGIRYLDQGSRAAGQGTRNYVVFPGAEDSIRILRKFAVPGLIGAGAASLDGQPE